MTDIKVGDEVKVFDGWHARHDRTPVPGEVVKVGRTLVTIRWGGQCEKFRMDTGVINDAIGGTEFETLEQADAHARKNAALALLKEAGFEVSIGRRPDDDLIQKLAAAALEWTAERTTR